MQEKASSKELKLIRSIISATDMDAATIASYIGADESNVRRWWRGDTLPSLRRFLALYDLAKKAGFKGDDEDLPDIIIKILYVIKHVKMAYFYKFLVKDFIKYAINTYKWIIKFVCKGQKPYQNVRF